MPLPRRMHLLVAALIAVAVLPVVIPPVDDEVSPVSCPYPDASDALIRDAQHYAKDFGVDLEEALCRLILQEAIGELGAELEANEGDTFSGLRIQNAPDYRVIVEFTTGGEATMARYLQDNPLAAIVDVRDADVTLEYLEAAQWEAMRIAEAVGVPAESGIMIQDNRVEVYVTDSKEFWDAVWAANLRLPHNVAVIEVPRLSQPASKPLDGPATYSALT